MNITQVTRFKDAAWFPKEETNVVIGGAGGIGSWLTLMLSRAGFMPIVYDFDTIEEHNIGGQLYGESNVEQLKVVALKGIVKEFAGTEVDTFNEKYERDSMSHHYVFSGFDNMKARKDMFEAWKEYVQDWKDMNDLLPEGEHDKNIPIFIDGRLLMEQLTIFCVTPINMEKYEAHLFDDNEVREAPCTLKQTSHSAAMIASHMVGLFTNHMANNAEQDTDREVPFKWEHFIPMNLTQQSNE